MLYYLCAFNGFLLRNASKKATLKKTLGYLYPEIAFIVRSMTVIMSFY